MLSGKRSVVEVVQYFIKSIESRSSLNAFLEVFEEDALAQAKQQDEQLQAGKTLGKLFGVVVGIKDVLCYKGKTTTAGSTMLANFKSIYNATAVQKLLDEDAIIIGRLNCDEFAMGSTGENSAFGPAKNAADESRVSGGSSGGSAVAVQAGLCHVSLGSDTGGSVRMPASYCGVIGIKPTYGRVSRHGLIAYASSFDQIGVMANHIDDAALVTEIIAGQDDFDSTLADVEELNLSNLKEDYSPKKIAVFKEVIESEVIDMEIKAQFLQSLDKLKAAGHIIKEVSFPYLNQIVATYYILTTAEASSNLARYDGIHYGYRSPNAKNLDETYVKSRSEAFGKEVQKRIMLGTFVLSSENYDAYYTKAQKVRRLIDETTQKIFEEHDFIISPTTVGVAFPIGYKITNPLELYLSDIFTVQANLAGGIPAISLPIFIHPKNNLPCGLQLIANKFQEANLIAFSKYLFNQYQ